VKIDPNPRETQALALVREAGPREAHRRLIAENNAAILSDDLDRGREMVAARTAIYSAIASDWVQRQQAEFGYTRPFALAAVGGTGREEVCPCSDHDFVLLFDDDLKKNEFWTGLRRQTSVTGSFEQEHGFGMELCAFALDEGKKIVGKDLNSFLDLRPIYDPHDLTSEFRRKIKATCDPFEHFLHVREFWKTKFAQAPACESLDDFDIKNDALRIFQAGVWTLAGQGYRHSHEIYEQRIERRDLKAYHFLIRLRSWVHLQRPPGGRPTLTGNHPEDVLTFADFASFGEMSGPNATKAERLEFANEVRARFLSARRRVAAFARGVIEQELRRGRRVTEDSAIAYGPAGLYLSVPQQEHDGHMRSRSALSLLLTAQQYGISIDVSELQTTFQNAGDWLERVPEVGALFTESRGSLADSFAFLSQVDGAEERLFPGRSRFEVSFDERVLSEKRELRAASELRKLRALEEYLKHAKPVDPEKTSWTEDDVTPEVAVAYLDPNHLAAVKLALKTKRLPMTEDDEAIDDHPADEPHKPSTSGFSGIPLAGYYQRIGPECGFTSETLAATEFLVANRRTFKLLGDEGQNDRDQVQWFHTLCDTEQRLHALFVFTYADRFEWENERTYPTRWFGIRELYLKTWREFHKAVINPAATLGSAGFTQEDQRILSDFGEDFFSGLYHRHANRFGTDLVRLAEADHTDSAPKAALLHEGASRILGVAARDFRGLAACISGALWKERIGLHQAHFFSAMNYHLALDFFHLAPGDRSIPADLPRIVEQAVRGQLHISAADKAELPRLGNDVTLQAIRPGHFRSRCQADRDTGGLIYALCWKLFYYLHADIHALNASATRDGAFVTIYHSLPESMPLEEARRIVSSVF
jgi:hypothetical protein